MGRAIGIQRRPQATRYIHIRHIYHVLIEAEGLTIHVFYRDFEKRLLTCLDGSYPRSILLDV